MNKFLILFGLMVSSSSFASSITCFTNYWGDSKAQVIANLNPDGRTGLATLLIDEVVVSQAQSDLKIIQKGKYNGYTTVDLGVVTGGGYDGGNMYYSLYLPAGFQSQTKFKAIVYSHSADGYGSGPATFICKNN